MTDADARSAVVQARQSDVLILTSLRVS